MQFLGETSSSRLSDIMFRLLKSVLSNDDKDQVDTLSIQVKLSQLLSSLSALLENVSSVKTPVAGLAELLELFSATLHRLCVDLQSRSSQTALWRGQWLVRASERLAALIGRLPPSNEKTRNRIVQRLLFCLPRVAYSLLPLSVAYQPASLPNFQLAVTHLSRVWPVTSRTGVMAVQMPAAMLKGAMESAKDCLYLSRVGLPSGMADLSLVGCDGGEVTVRNLSREARMTFKVEKDEKELGNETAWITLERSKMNFHEFNVTPVTDGRLVQLRIELQSPPLALRPFPIDLYLRQGHKPTTRDYLLKKSYEPTETRITLVLNSTLISEPDIYFIGLVDSNLNVGRPNPLEMNQRRYRFSLWSTSCLYWKPSTNSWLSDGCEVVPTFHTTSVECKCDHLTTFTTHVSQFKWRLSQHPVDNFFSPSPNYNPLIITLVLLSLLLLLSPLTMHSDYDAIQSLPTQPLTDNSKSHRHAYEVMVDTGLWPGSGTTSRVFLVLHGERGIAETRELTAIASTSTPLLRTATRNRFLVTYPEPLGALRRLHLWHTNEGTSPSWTVQQLAVRDLHSGRTFVFHCKQRLSTADRVDLQFSTSREKWSCRQFMRLHLAPCLAAWHPWISLFLSPSWRAPLRSESLLLCLATISLASGGIAVWLDRQELEFRGEEPLAVVQWRGLILAGATAAVLTGVVAMATALYTLTKPFFVSGGLLLDNGALLSLDSFSHSTERSADSIKSLTEDDEELEEAWSEVVDSSIPREDGTRFWDQPISNWRIFQYWAERTWANKGKKQPATGAGAGRQAGRRRTHPEDEDSQTRLMPGAERRQDREPLRAGLLPAASCSRRALGLLLDLVCVGVAVAGVYFVASDSLSFGTVRNSLFCQALLFGILLHVFLLQPIFAFFVAAIQCLAAFVSHKNGVPAADTQSSRDETLLKFLLVNSYEVGHSLEKCIESRSRSRYLRFAHPPTVAADTAQGERSKRSSFLFTRRFLLSLLLPLLFAPMVWHEAVGTKASLTQYQRLLLAEVTSKDAQRLADVKRQWLTRNWSQIFSCEAGNCYLGTSQSILIGPVQMLSWPGVSRQCPSWMKRYPLLRDKSCRPALNADGRRFFSTDPILDNPRLQNHSTIRALHDKILVMDFEGEQGSYDPQTASHVVWVETVKEAKLSDSIKTFVTRLSNSSRAFVLSTTIYYPPSDLILSLRLLVEAPTLGPVSTSIDIKISRLDRYSSGWRAHLLFAADVLILFLILAWTHTVIGKLTKGCKTFDITMQALACLFGLVYIVMFLVRAFLQQPILDLIRLTSREVFVDLHFLCLWDEMITAAMGITMFFSILSSLHLFKFFSVTQKFHKTFKRAKGDLFMCWVVFCILILTFVHFANSLLASSSPYTSSPGLLILGVLSVLARSPVYPSDAWPWRLLLLLLLFTFGFLKAYVLAALCHHLRRILRSQTPGAKLLSPGGFVRAVGRSLARLLERQRRKEGEGRDTELPAEFVLAEVEYQVDEMLFKMHALAAADEPIVRRRSLRRIGGEESGSGRASEEADLGLILPAIDLRFLPEEDEEKQFRSQLEMEIFRQLQVVRDQISSQGSGSDTSRLLLQQRESPRQTKRLPGPIQSQNRLTGPQISPLPFEAENLIPVTCLDGEEDGEWVEMEDLTEQRQLNPPCVSPPRQPFW